MGILHIITNAIIFFGFYIVYNGWQQIHAVNEVELVTDGIYSYIRHPQYVGMWMVTVGFLIQWPTLITVVMWPVLMILYHSLSRREEKALHEKFGKRFERYKAEVPGYFPEFRKNYSYG